MVAGMTELAKGLALPSFFIGSVILWDGTKGKILEQAISQAQTVGQIHLPQTPQRGIKDKFSRWSMDGEALHSGSPFFITPKGKIAYDLVVSPDKGVEPGIIISRKGTQENLDTLELAVAELIHSTKKEGYNPENVNRKLNKLISLYSLPCRDSFSAQLPDSLKELIKYLEHNPDNIPDVIKLQISGPMNTAQNLCAYNEKGELEQGLVAQNQRLLSIHAGLIFARSLFWTRAVETALSKSGKKPEIIFSFDEPCFEKLDSGFGTPEKGASVEVYSQL